MARKRMISPSMWESESFSELSDFSKLVFISLISHADDEGRGKAKPATIANITFPNDDNRRVADIKKALQEIALHMSVQFYSVDGREYYALTNWLEYQKIDKPTKSKLPPPPIVGVWGAIPNRGNIDDNSGSIRGVFGESSPPNIIEDNRIEDKYTHNSAGACAREEQPTEFEIKFKAFCEKWDIADDNYYSPLIAEFDFDKLDRAYSESLLYLGDKEKAPWAHTISGLVKKYNSIIAGKYKDKTDSDGTKSTVRKQAAREQTTDILKNLFNEYKGEENNGKT